MSRMRWPNRSARDRTSYKEHGGIVNSDIVDIGIVNCGIKNSGTLVLKISQSKIILYSYSDYHLHRLIFIFIKNFMF